MHKNNDAVLNEYLLFHGTRSKWIISLTSLSSTIKKSLQHHTGTHPEKIYNGLNAAGFDPRLGGGYYGQGAYFAEELKYSYNGYSYTSGRNRQLFLAAVLTGKSKAYGSRQDQQLRRAPELPNRRGLYVVLMF